MTAGRLPTGSIERVVRRTDVVGTPVSYEASQHAAHEALGPGLHCVHQAVVGRRVDENGAIGAVLEPQIARLDHGRRRRPVGRVAGQCAQFRRSATRQRPTSAAPIMRPRGRRLSTVAEGLLTRPPCGAQIQVAPDLMSLTRAALPPSSAASAALEQDSLLRAPSASDRSAGTGTGKLARTHVRPGNHITDTLLSRHR